jgi:hypothetical protein
MSKAEQYLIEAAALTREIMPMNKKIKELERDCTGGNWDEFSHLQKSGKTGLNIGPSVITKRCVNTANSVMVVLNKSNPGEYSVDHVLSLYGCRACNEHQTLHSEVKVLRIKANAVRSQINILGRQLLLKQEEK